MFLPSPADGTRDTWFSGALSNRGAPLASCCVFFARSLCPLYQPFQLLPGLSWKPEYRRDCSLRWKLPGKFTSSPGQLVNRLYKEALLPWGEQYGGAFWPQRLGEGKERASLLKLTVSISQRHSEVGARMRQNTCPQWNQRDSPRSICICYPPLPEVS